MAVSGDFWGKPKRGVRYAGREECGVGRSGSGALCAERQNGARRSFARRRHDGPRGGGVRASSSTFLPASRSFCFVFTSLGKAAEALWLRVCRFLVWERSAAAVAQGFAPENRGAQALGAGVGERSGLPRFWVMQLSLLR